MSDVRAAQERLGRALDRARASEDRLLAARVREEGSTLVNLLCGVLRMSHLHAADNQAFDQPMRDLAAALGRLVELLGPVHLTVVEDQVYLNDIRVRMEERPDAPKELAGEFRRHQVGGLTFRDPLSEPQLRLLVGALAQAPAAERRRSALREALAGRGLHAVEVTGIFRLRVTGEELAPESADSHAERARTLVDESFANLAAERLPNPLPIRRAVAELLARDGGGEDEPDGAGSSALAAHTLRVTRLALRLGEAIGLSEGVLQDLGVAAMFHDVGYAARDRGEPPPFRNHGSSGARLLLRQRGFHEAKVRRVRAVLEHHRDLGHEPRPGLFARILRVAEDYDTLRQARGGALSAADALGRIAAGAGTRYDPVLVQALVNGMLAGHEERGPLFLGELDRLLSDLHRGARQGRITVRRDAREHVAWIAGSELIHPPGPGLEPAFVWDDGEWVFEPDEPPPPGATIRQPLGNVILAAVRALADPDVVRYALGDLDRPVRFVTDPRLGSQRLAFSASELHVLSAVEGHVTARRALGMLGVSPHESHRALLALVRSGLVEIGDR